MKQSWAVIICKEVRVLILCNLRRSATQQFSLSRALAGPFRVVRNTPKQGKERAVLIPFFAFNYSLPSQRSLQPGRTAVFAGGKKKKKKGEEAGSRTALCSTLSPRDEGLAEQLFALLKYVSH